MKAFLFNYEKFLEENDKIPYILSERSAKERTISLRGIIEKFFVNLIFIFYF